MTSLSHLLKENIQLKKLRESSSTEIWVLSPLGLVDHRPLQHKIRKFIDTADGDDDYYDDDDRDDDDYGGGGGGSPFRCVSLLTKGSQTSIGQSFYALSV